MQSSFCSQQNSEMLTLVLERGGWEKNEPCLTFIVVYELAFPRRSREKKWKICLHLVGMEMGWDRLISSNASAYSYVHLSNVTSFEKKVSAEIASSRTFFLFIDQ